MKKIISLLAVTLIIIVASVETNYAQITLPAIISSDYACSSNNIYLINGTVTVTNGALLQINAGTVIKGVSSTSKLYIAPDGRIDAQGTNTKPVIFTSNKAVPQPYDWYGIQIEGESSEENQNHSSGILKYVRIEYAYRALIMDIVGRSTEIDFVEVYKCANGFEFNGGYVNAKHLISAYTENSQGFYIAHYGNIQYALSVGDGLSVLDDNSYATNHIISNLTVIGLEDSISVPLTFGAEINLFDHDPASGGESVYRNSVFMGKKTGALFSPFSTPTTVANFQYNIIHAFSTTVTGATINATNTQFLGDYFNSNARIGLNDPFNLNTPDFRPTSASSPAATGANFSGLTTIPPNFFQTTTYRGAFPTTLQNWVASWSRF